MIPRIVLFALLTGAVWVADAVYLTRVEPRQSASLAVAAVNGGDKAAADARLHAATKDGFVVLPWVLTAALFVMCFGSVMIGPARKVVRS